MVTTLMVASVMALLLLHTSRVQAAPGDDMTAKPDASVAPEAPPPSDSDLISPEEQQAGFVRLWSEAKYNFASFDNVPEVNWDKVLEEYLPQFSEPRDEYHYYRILEKCLAQLRDGHTRVDNVPAPGEDRPLVLIRPVEGKAVMTRVAGNPELSAQGVKPGCVVVRVDGRDVKDILEKDLYPYVCASTPQMRDENAYWRILDGPLDVAVSVVIVDLQGAERTVTLTRNWRNFPDIWAGWRVLDAPRVRSRADVIRASLGIASTEALAEVAGVFEYRNLEGDFAYVALRSFMTDEGPRAFEKVLDRVRSSKGLIIDVRDNSGGSTGNGFAVISRLIDKPVKGETWRCPQHISAFKAWGDKMPQYVGKPAVVEPATDMPPFLGPVVVLTGATTISAAEDFLIPLHFARRAVLVGEPTAGSTGQPLIVDLPGGGAALVCAKHDTYPDGREFVGIGVIPDVEVHPTVADIASGRDAVLEKGIEVLKGLSVDHGKEGQDVPRP